MKDKGSSIVEEVSLDKQEVSENHENEHKDFDKLIDKAGIFLAEREGIYGEIQEGEEKRIVRKLDWRLLPMLFFTATLGAVDKQCISTAAIYGFTEDNNLLGSEYSWLGSIIFIGSLVGMWPMTFILQKFRLGMVLVVASLLWSALTLLFCAGHNFAGFAALRFLLGFIECAIVPGCTLMVTRFYIKKEQAPRLAYVFAFASSVINGFLSWLVGNFNDNIPKWKYLYLMVGSISFTWSCFIFFYLPDTPMNTKFLTDREKYFLIKKVVKNQTGIESNDWKWEQMVEALLEPKSYIIMLFNIGINITNGGLSAFSSIIINNLGFSAMESSLMSMPTGVIATLATIGFTYATTKFPNKRCLICVISLFIPLIGAILLYTIDQSKIGPQLFGLYLAYFYFAPYVIMMSLAQANTAGNTKKSVVYSMNYLGYAAGALIGPQTFRAEEAPKYTGGFTGMMVSFCVCILLSILYWFICVLNNRNKKAMVECDQNIEIQIAVASEETDLMYDLTDKQQATFLYTT
jgi:MFS family permease